MEGSWPDHHRSAPRALCHVRSPFIDFSSHFLSTRRQRNVTIFEEIGLTLFVICNVLSVLSLCAHSENKAENRHLRQWKLVFGGLMFTWYGTVLHDAVWFCLIYGCCWSTKTWASSKVIKENNEMKPLILGRKALLSANLFLNVVTATPHQPQLHSWPLCYCGHWLLNSSWLAKVSGGAELHSSRLFSLSLSFITPRSLMFGSLLLRRGRWHLAPSTPSAMSPPLHLRTVRREYRSWQVPQLAQHALPYLPCPLRG